MIVSTTEMVMSDFMNDEYYTIKTASTFMNVTESTIRNWIKCGYLESDNRRISFKQLKDLKTRIDDGSVSKLNKRANKSLLKNTFIPEEYLCGADDDKLLTAVLTYIDENSLAIEESINFILLNLLAAEGLIVVNGREVTAFNKIIDKEIKSWNPDFTDDRYVHLLDFTLPEHHDFAGIVYQSLLKEGDKSRRGSYYTPVSIVDPIAAEYVNPHSRVLDPCCGTGQFLLTFSGTVVDPEKICGFDIDPVAVKISRINLIIKYKNIEFEPRIYCLDSLTETPDIGKFDVIATNPPWGAHFSSDDAKLLTDRYPSVLSNESFSYFMNMCLKLLKKSGVLSFILPESLLNVKIHQDIRKYILNFYSIKKIYYLGAVFKKVFTPVIRIDIKNEPADDNHITILNKHKTYSIPQNRWLGNSHHLFDIHLSESDKEVIEKIYRIPHTTLKGNAQWALGIVTGHNEKVIADEWSAGYEPVYTGKNIEPFYLKPADCFIRFTPGEYQQVAPEWKYRAPEKLVYKFISRFPVFAYDTTGALTLNSANIVIPGTGYPMKVILALFNSSIYKFLYKKKFASIKILKSHIEQLPLPFFTEAVYKKIESLVDDILRNKPGEYAELDEYIFECFAMDANEKRYIHESIIE